MPIPYSRRPSGELDKDLDRTTQRRRTGTRSAQTPEQEVAIRQSAAESRAREPGGKLSPEKRGVRSEPRKNEVTVKGSRASKLPRQAQKVQPRFGSPTPPERDKTIKGLSPNRPAIDKARRREP
jgi:hypothetical protein